MRPTAPGMRAIGLSLRCYPAWWRERYGAEQEDPAEELAAEGRRPWLLGAGLLAGSARARLTLMWLTCAAQLLATGSHLAARLLALAKGRRLKAAAFVAAPIAAVVWAGWAVAVGGWAVGLLALGRATARSKLSTTAFQVAVSNAQTTALTQGCFVLSLIALEVTMAFQTPIGPQGGLVWASRLGPFAVPVLVILAAIAALSVSGAASAHSASARLRRRLS
jgi:hypothetical protein